MRGIIDGRQIEVLLGRPYHLQGPVGVDGVVGLKDGAFQAGRASGDDRLFIRDTPGNEKGPGVESSAFVSLHGKKGGEIHVDSLDYTLGPLEC